MRNRPVHVTVMVKPNSKKVGVSFENGTLLIRVHEPAREGTANNACRSALAQALGLARSQVILLRGANSRRKVFALTALSEAELQTRLLRYQL